MLFVYKINFVLKSQHKMQFISINCILCCDFSTKLIVITTLANIGEISKITAFGNNHGKRQKLWKSQLP